MTDSEKKAAALTALLLTRRRKAEKALVKAEASTSRALKSAAAGVLGMTIAQVAVGRATPGGALSRDVAASAVRAGIGAMSRAVTESLVAGRLEAANAGLDDLAANLDEDEVGVPFEQPYPSDEDHARAQAGGSSYAAAWGMGALLLAKKVKDRREFLNGLAKHHQQTLMRIDRLATTEVADAFNGARFEAAMDAQMRLDRLPGNSPPKMVREWSADLDAHTCDDCMEAHGTRVGMDEDFPWGEPPLHANCRCVCIYAVS